MKEKKIPIPLEELREQLKSGHFVRFGGYAATSDKILEEKYPLYVRDLTEGRPERVVAPSKEKRLEDVLEKLADAIDGRSEGSDSGLDLDRLEALERSLDETRAAHDQLVEAHEKLVGEHEALKASVGVPVAAEGEVQTPAEQVQTEATAPVAPVAPVVTKAAGK